MENLKLDDFCRYTFISGVEYSPNGAHVCYVVHKPDLEENNYTSNLWLYNPKTEQQFQLTAGAREKGYIWLDDSEHILFPGARDPKLKERQAEGEELTVFYKINIHGGEAQELFRIPLAIKVIRQVDADRFLVLATQNPSRPSLEALSDEERAKELKARKEDKDFEVLEEIPFWSNGEGFVSMNRTRVFLYDLRDSSLEALTEEKLQVQSINLSPDRSQAVLIGQLFAGKEDIYNALYRLDLEDKTVGLLSPQGEFSYSTAHFLTQNQIIARSSSMERFGLNENTRFFLVDSLTGEQQLLTPDFETSTWSSVGSDCRYGGSEQVKVRDGYLYFLTTEGSSSFINRLDAAGNITKLTNREGSVDSYDVHQGSITMVAMRDLKLQELYRLVSGAEQQLSHYNDWVQAESKLAALEPLSVETSPGISIDGWVMQPVDRKPNQKYPAILNIHGGPKTVYGQVFFHEMQYWANQGYYVFFCNPRGSDGKGNEFADLRGKYGTIDYDDIMAFTDAVLERYPAIDQQRLGVTGGSYGGFMTNWIIGHTQRFRAAASQRSISNWVSMSLTSDIGYYFEPDQVGATPWTDIDRLWQHSPLKYADQVKTPTLFIHSEEDYRCWLPEGMQMFTALKYHGVESRFCMFRGENHELSRSGKPRPRIRRLREITDWFQKYLGPAT